MWRWFPSSMPLTVTPDRSRTTFRTTNRWTGPGTGSGVKVPLCPSGPLYLPDRSRGSGSVPHPMHIRRARVEAKSGTQSHFTVSLFRFLVGWGPGTEVVVLGKGCYHCKAPFAASPGPLRPSRMPSPWGPAPAPRTSPSTTRSCARDGTFSGRVVGACGRSGLWRSSCDAASSTRRRTRTRPRRSRRRVPTTRTSGRR